MSSEPVVFLRSLGVLQVGGPVALAGADLRAHAHGAEYRDADVVRSQILLERLAQPHHGVLARVVDAETLRRDEPGHGRRVDDVSGLLLRDHARHEGFDPVDDAPEIDVQHPFPVAVRGRFEPAVDGDTGVVADDVRPAHLLPGALRERLHRSELGHVGLDGERPGAGLLHAGGGLRHAGFVDVRHHDMGALAREAEAERAPDSAGSAGDDRRLSLEVFHVVSLWMDPVSVAPGAKGCQVRPGRRWYYLPPWTTACLPPSCPSATI